MASAMTMMSAVSMAIALISAVAMVIALMSAATMDIALTSAAAMVLSMMGNDDNGHGECGGNCAGEHDNECKEWVCDHNHFFSCRHRRAREHASHVEHRAGAQRIRLDKWMYIRKRLGRLA